VNTSAASPESVDPESHAEAQITLGMLNAVEENSVLTQRSLARELGIALGLANAYLKRCVTKGYIKVTHVPAKRYAYYLTPKGFAEKSRLTARYLAISSVWRAASAMLSSPNARRAAGHRSRCAALASSPRLPCCARRAMK